MYEISTAEHTPVNLMAGNFPVVTECGPVKEGATVRKYAPVSLTADGITEADTASLDTLCGIAADDPTEGGVVYFMTGEFFADALTLPDGVTADALKPAFRKLGIFLR